MILLRNIKVALNCEKTLRDICAEELKTDPSEIISSRLLKRSIDARRKSDVHFVCNVVVAATNENKLVRKNRNAQPYSHPEREAILPVRDKGLQPPVVVGCGPAGLFAALELAKYGYKPIVIERGKPVDERTEAVKRFWATHELDENCNVQFGEGGAGTFSDGKLNTGIKDERIGAVLDTFVIFGAPEDILYDANAHIGTDLLSGIVKRMREEIIRLGGTVLFNHCLTDIELNGGIKSVTCKTPDGARKIECDTVIMAIGHSARDTFELLKSKGVPMERKPFSVGVRIEHLQSNIDRARYGNFAGNSKLGAANYKLAAHIGGRGVYSFCMCPGGTVVAAASEKGAVVTNGMSNRARDGVNANSALLVGVGAEDFSSDDVLAGMYFQRKIEQAAYKCSDSYKAIAQRVDDFVNSRESTHFGNVKPSYTAGVCMSDLNLIFPDYVSQTIKCGLSRFGEMISGFDDGDAVLTGPETRSSSPVRILRSANCRSLVRGLYPCGEGAGYAGGIVSAAVDGIRCAEAVMLNKVE